MPNDILEKFDPSFCKFGCSSGDHVHICERNRSIEPDVEFNSEWIGTNLKSQKWKTKKLVCPFLLAPFHFETNLINGFPFISDNCGQFGNFFQLSLKVEKLAGWSSFFWSYHPFDESMFQGILFSYEKTRYLVKRKILSFSFQVIITDDSYVCIIKDDASFVCLWLLTMC